VHDRCEDMHSVSNGVGDATALNDVDSGLQMALSPSSTVSTGSLGAGASLPQPLCRLAAAAAGVGITPNTGLWNLDC